MTKDAPKKEQLFAQSRVLEAAMSFCSIGKVKENDVEGEAV
jgi:hypothetical protein